MIWATGFSSIESGDLHWFTWAYGIFPRFFFSGHARTQCTIELATQMNGRWAQPTGKETTQKRILCLGKPFATCRAAFTGKNHKNSVQVEQQGHAGVCEADQSSQLVGRLLLFRNNQNETHERASHGKYFTIPFQCIPLAARHSLVWPLRHLLAFHHFLMISLTSDQTLLRVSLRSTWWSGLPADATGGTWVTYVTFRLILLEWMCRLGGCAIISNGFH